MKISINQESKLCPSMYHATFASSHPSDPKEVKADVICSCDLEAQNCFIQIYLIYLNVYFPPEDSSRKLAASTFRIGNGGVAAIAIARQPNGGRFGPRLEEWEARSAQGDRWVN